MSSSSSSRSSLFSSFFFYSLLLFCLASLCAIHVRDVSFSQPSTHSRISFFFPLSFSQAYFFSSRTTLLQTSDVSPLSRSFCFFFASVNDPGVSLRPHSSCELYCAHARELCRGEPERARDSPLAASLFTLRVGVPATEQISNK